MSSKGDTKSYKLLNSCYENLQISAEVLQSIIKCYKFLKKCYKKLQISPEVLRGTEKRHRKGTG